MICFPALASVQTAHVTSAQAVQKDAIALHAHKAAPLLASLGKVLAEDSDGAVLAVRVTLQAGVRRRIEHAPSAHAHGVTSVTLELDAREATRVVRVGLGRIVMSKAPCGAQCTLAHVPATVAPGATLDLPVEMRYAVIS